MKLSFTHITIIATLTGIATGGVAFANQHKGGKDDGERQSRAERLFETWDADKDGKVTAEEVKAYAAERFGKRDMDGDGVISRDDRQKHRAAMRDERRTERFNAMDADGDGMISLDEFKQAGPERGERGDRAERGDRGDRAERGERGERGERREGRRGHHGGKGHHGDHAGKRGGKRGGKGMRRGGRHGGGVLTIQEAEARAMQRFERIDTDSDGVITLEDLQDAMPRRGGRR